MVSEELSFTLSTGQDQTLFQKAACIQGNMIGRADKNGPQGGGVNEELSFTLNATDVHGVAKGYTVRRLTPIECERLQGFPDNYTRVPYRGKPAEECPDAPRYKALGNSFCVPVVRWIFERIEAVENDD